MVVKKLVVPETVMLHSLDTFLPSLRYSHISAVSRTERHNMPQEDDI